MLKYFYDLCEGHKFYFAFHNFFYSRRIIIVLSVRSYSEGRVSTVIQCNSSSTDAVCNGNRRPINSRHTEDCHLQLNRDMFCGTHDFYTSLRTTLPAVLADSLLHCFLLRVGRDHQHIQQYISESGQSCDDSKQLLQGEKQQQFYVRRNFLEICVVLLYNPYCLFLHNPFEIILFNFAFSCHNLLITE